MTERGSLAFSGLGARAAGPTRRIPRSRSSGGSGKPRGKKCILFLADRNILGDQTRTNDFKPSRARKKKRTSSGSYVSNILFCEDIDHAERRRQALVNENADLVAEDRL